MNTDKIIAEKIANEYVVKTTSKVTALKKLDEKVKKGPFVFSLSFGIVGSLILGTGMSLAMKVIGSGTTTSMILGIIIGLLGILIVSVNYPIYKKLLKRNKDKYASDIMSLAQEIIEEA